MGQTKRAQKNESSIPKHYQNCASKDLCFQWSLVTLVCLQIGTPKKIRGFSCFSHGSPIQGEPWGPTRNKFPASRQQTGVPQHLCGLHLGKGKIGRQDVLFEEKNHIFFQNIIIFGFLQGNPTESILLGCANIIETENIPT